jgi:purine-binding chemotaxis protein CheW
MTGGRCLNPVIMKEQSKTRLATIQPQQAVQEYLDALLQEATAISDPLAAVTQTQHADETVVPSTPSEIPDRGLDSVVQVAQESLQQKDLEVDPGRETTPWINGRPPWAQERFDCLLFKVAGLMLAVPLVELGGVLTIEAELKPLFGQPDWFLGLLPSKAEGTVRVVDTARWVMPERYSESSRENLKYVILMEKSEWGIACHGVAKAITLEPNQVSWRTNRGLRPWLAGTVIEHMCALMDVSALVKLLQAEDVNRDEQR